MGEHFADPNTGACKIYPFWREKLREIYPSPFYNNYNEVLVMLGIGKRQRAHGKQVKPMRC